MEDQLMDSPGAPIREDNDTLFDAPPMAEQERMVEAVLFASAEPVTLRDLEGRMPHAFHQLCAFVARQANFPENCFTQIHSCQCFFAHTNPRCLPKHMARGNSLSISMNCAGCFGRKSGRKGYQRSTTAPQARPPPMASVTIRSPSLIWPRSLPTERASGMEAAEVLP